MSGTDPVARVLVTRPEPVASRTAQRLRTLGYTPLLLPLSETRSLPIDPSAIAEGNGAIAVTSANAIRHLTAEVAAALAHSVCYCVGEKTAEAASEAGFQNIVDSKGNSETLARAIIESGLDASIVYLCGRTRLPVFEDTLAAAGIAVDPVEVYATLPVERDIATISAALEGLPVDAALIYSVLSAKALADLVMRPQISALFEDTQFFCLSNRIADALHIPAGNRTHPALEPTEDALLSLMRCFSP